MTVVYNLIMNNFVFSRMNINHVLKMRSWQKNENPLLESYDFWPRTFDECNYWYLKKTEKSYNEYYVYVDNDEIICYVSIKNINKKIGSATLGIVMNPAYQSKGYGYIIMQDFLKRYFDHGYKSMNLTVARFNARAIKLYKKLGFKIERRTYSLFDGNKEQIDKDSRDYFIFLPGLIISKDYLMSIRR